MTSSSPTLHSSSAATPSVEEMATDDQHPLTKATIIVFGWLAKVADLPTTRVESFVPKLVVATIAKDLNGHMLRLRQNNMS